MDFNLNIGTLTITIEEYEKLMVTLLEQKENINQAISNLFDLGWSGEARDKFETVHNIKQQHYNEFQEDVKYIKETLETEEKTKAVLLKKRCEAFVDCVARGGISAEGTSDDEGIISLDFGGVYPMKNIIDQCTFSYYNKMKIDFEDILGIINNLDYTSFNIGGDLFSTESSLRDQTLRLTDFDDSLALYYQGIQDMESNICSKLGKISGVSTGISNAGSSSLISPSGDINPTKMQELMLKDQEKLTDLDKQSLEYIKNILGEDMYNTVKEAIINNSKINISKDPLKDLPMYTICILYKDGDRVQLCAPSGQYFAATVTLSNNVPEIKFDDQDGYASACRGQYASVQDGLSEIVKAGIKSGNSFKEIGSDFYSGLKNRGDKAFDSPSDFLNWATLGAPDIIKATVQANAERSDKAFSSVYDGINWITLGSADMVKGTFNPEDPLSKEHWLNSFGTASVIFGGRGATSSIEKTSMIDHIPSNEILNKGVSKADGDAIRNIVDTHGLRNELPLTDAQVQELTNYAKSLGFSEDNIVICGPDSTYNTGLVYGQRLYINNDVLPSTMVTNNPNALISGEGTIAHEIVGHYETICKGTSFETTYIDIDGSIKYNYEHLALDEAQASIRAARFAPNLSRNERMKLIRDGLTRLKNQGINLKDVKKSLDIYER